jgi:hypothetical protein
MYRGVHVEHRLFEHKPIDPRAESVMLSGIRL